MGIKNGRVKSRIQHDDQCLPAGGMNVNLNQREDRKDIYMYVTGSWH